MFTALSLLLRWYIGRDEIKQQSQDSKDYSRLYDDQATKALLHIRQDVRLACFTLGGILIMLGIIADILFFAR